MGFALSKLFSLSIFGLCLLLLGVLVPLNTGKNIHVLGQLETSQQHQSPDPTLKEHSDNDSTFDTSTVPSSPIAVQGSYTDVTSGLKVTFPPGWSGYDTIDSDNVKTVSVSIQPQSSTSSSSSSKNFEDGIPPYIFVEISPKNTILNSEKQLHYKNIVNYDSIESTKSCDLLSSSNITISSVPAKEIAYSCPFPFNPSIKQLTKAIAIDTNQVNIAIEITAVSESNYEKYLPDFESLVKSIQFS